MHRWAAMAHAMGAGMTLSEDSSSERLRAGENRRSGLESIRAGDVARRHRPAGGVFERIAIGRRRDRGDRIADIGEVGDEHAEAAADRVVDIWLSYITAPEREMPSRELRAMRLAATCDSSAVMRRPSELGSVDTPSLSRPIRLRITSVGGLLAPVTRTADSVLLLIGQSMRKT